MKHTTKRNLHTIELENTTLENFEFIVGPMIGVNISSPPYPPEAFIKNCHEGGATPIASSRYIVLEEYLSVLDYLVGKMEGRFFGGNLLCIWTKAKEFLDEFKKRGDQTPSFLDLNAIELVMEDFLPLLRDVQVPLFMGIHYPMSISFFKKLLEKPEHFHMIDRIASGNLTIYAPQNVGGGHLPSVTKEQMDKNSIDEIIFEILSLGKAIGHPVPFVIEKGLTSVEDFVKTIGHYARYPSFKGVRFASNLLLSKEITLNPKLRALLREIVLDKRRDWIIPIRSQLGATRQGKKVRGGVLMWAVATEIIKDLHKQQCDGTDFPKLRRPYMPDILKRQADRTDAVQKKLCAHCHENCPQEICGYQLGWHSLEKEGLVEEASITVSPKIIDLNPNYIDASAEFIVNDIISRSIAILEGNANRQEEREAQSDMVDA